MRTGFQSKIGLSSLAFLFLLTGCSKGVAPVSTSAELSADGFTIDVKTLPGLVADIYGKKVKADAAGLARFELTPGDLYYRSETSVLIRVSGRAGLTSYLAETAAVLPISPSTAAQFPRAPQVLAIIGKEQVAGKETSRWKIGDSAQADFATDGTLALYAMGPRLATVTVGGQAAKTDRFGVGSIVLSTEDLLGFVTCTGSSFDEPVPSGTLGATVSAPGAPDKQVSLPLEWQAFSGQSFRTRLSALSARSLGGARATPSLVVYLAANDRISCEGRAGTLATADAVAVATPKPARKLSDCTGYRRVNDKREFVGGEESVKREGIDEDVVAVDAHTGRELGRRTFEAQDTCDLFPGKTLVTQQTRPSSIEVQSWLQALLRESPPPPAAPKPAPARPSSRPPPKVKRPSAQAPSDPFGWFAAFAVTRRG